MQRLWYGRSLWLKLVAWILLPLSWIFALIVTLRRFAYRVGVFGCERVERPVIVIGNITAGGVGKTPLAIWLARALRERGLTPGIITRGYGGRAREWPQHVTADSDVGVVGDEALLLALRTPAIVIAGPDRVADARRAIELGADVILSDDGLQHYRLHRDVEIVLLDAERGVGNGFYLPAGPLREGVGRLDQVDLVVVHRRGVSSSAQPELNAATLRIELRSSLGDAYSLVGNERRSLSDFTGQPVHAVAGIGHPEAFFDALRGARLEVDAKPLPVHAEIAAGDLRFADAAPVLMTEKDAVKCRRFADERCWAVELKTHMSEVEQATLLSLVERAIRSNATRSN